MNTQEFDLRLKGGIVVSCQPVADGPMDHDDVVARLGAAAIAGGAKALRIEGAARLAHVRRMLPQAFIIGIVKRELVGCAVRITPWLEDVDALADAGANMIAVDATDRPRPIGVEALLQRIRLRNCLAMADCASAQQGVAANALGFDVVGTTLSGYMGDAVPEAPDWALLQLLAQTCPRVMAEGRFNTPQAVRRAKDLGAWAVTVGTAITRTEHVTEWFCKA